MSLKSDSGLAQVAGVELMLLDFGRYFHRAGGIGGIAQAVHDLGQQANPRMLAQAAEFYENSTVRRVGFLLEHFGHERQARALRPFAAQAKSFKALNPAAEPIVPELRELTEQNQAWKLHINVPVEIDA
ncbi:MAG: type IV toxin-antitoxin system AbiEi family antitoxin [Fimbriiglobus sp.]